MKTESLNKSVVITGATSGIGYQTALDFAAEGAFVIGVGRDPQRCAESQQKILDATPEADVYFVTADLASQKQVRALAKGINLILDEKSYTGLDVLVNNAGVYMGKKVITEDGIETTFAINHIAPFLLTNLLLPRLSRSPDSRVITVSSGSHYQTRLIPERAKNPIFFFGLMAYKVSKLSNILFSLELNRLQKGKSPHAFAVDPGLVNTEIGIKGTGALAALVWRSKMKHGVPPRIPSKTILYLANNPEVLQSTEIYWHLCRPKQPSPVALDINLARRLWIESCKICSLPVPAEGDF